VGQASVPSLDAQVVESRRGPARRVAGFLFFSLPRLCFSLLLCGSPSFSVSVLVTKKCKKLKEKNRQIISKPLQKNRKSDKNIKSESEIDLAFVSNALDWILIAFLYCFLLFV